MSTSIVLLVLAAATLHAAWNFGARKIKGDLVVLWLSVSLAAVGSVVLAVVWVWRQGDCRFPWSYLVASSLLKACYYTLLAKSYEDGEISLVYPIARGTGVGGTAVMALVLAMESFSPGAAAGILVICVGTVLLAAGRLRPGKRWHALGLALLVGASIAGDSVVDKLGVGLAHPVVYISGNWVGTTLFMAPYVLLRHTGELRRTWRASWKYILAIGPASLVAYLLILFAFRAGPVSHIVAFREVSVVIGCVLGFLLLKEKCTVRKGIGILAIVGGMIAIRLT